MRQPDPIKTEAKSEYDFKPIKCDDTDEHTQSLFEQLEEGAKQYTDIYQTIKSGANLHATSTNDYEDCYPIHIAAYNIDSNFEAVDKILNTFDDPVNRKNYIFLKDGNDKNILDILLLHGEEWPSIRAFISVLSYLTSDEQKEALRELSEEAKDAFYYDYDDSYCSPPTRHEDINEFGQLCQFLQTSTVAMCQQRKKEEAQVQSGYDSGDEGLGSLGKVQNRKFTARVSYQKRQIDGITIPIPELSLIPSNWRLPTATEDNTQGDHVIAYVLLLSSLSHCQGEHIKSLPKTIYQMACRVLPDDRAYFLEKKKDIEAIIENHSEMRKEAVSALQHECDKSVEFVNQIEDSLKRTEIECVARHVEEVVDRFIGTVNALEGESFSQERKKNVKINFLLNKIASFIEILPSLQDDKFDDLKRILIQNILNESEKKEYNKNGTITNKPLEQIADQVIKAVKSITTCQIPDFLKSKSGNLTKTMLVKFLKDQTPLKKYHEGYEVKKIDQRIIKLERTESPQDREKLLTEIGESCARLFDYPWVGNAKLDDERVLYQAIPRHLIIFCCAFKELSSLKCEEKQYIYDSFLNHLLRLQLWSEHSVKILGRKSTTQLTLSLLKEKILDFADIDEKGNYSMKPTFPESFHLIV